MEHPEDPFAQPTCSNKQTEECEQAENAPVPMECVDPTGQTDELLELRPSDQEPDQEPCEPVVLSSESEDQPPELVSAEQAKLDDAATLAQRFVSEEWLNRFVEHLGRAPPLWRPGMHTSQANANIREKSKRGFAYTRLLTALEPNTVEGGKARIQRAQLMCKLFFKTLKQHLRKAAAKALESNPEASPDEALRSCPQWVQRADAFLNQMPLVVAHFNALRNDGEKKKKKPQATAEPLPRAALLHLAERPVGGAAGAALMRRVVRGMRRAAAQCGGPTRAAAAELARSLGDKEERMFALWCGMRKLSMYKFRATVARGDAPADTGRLDALDWAIVDLLFIHNAEIINESQYRNYEQLSALLGTFHLVQRFELERHQEKVSPQEWVDAARWYSRNRVQMSAVALQKRWYELKLDTRRRFQAQARGGSATLPLPLHQAIARRYGHVVTHSNLRSWRFMVADGVVAPPTSERGPAPGEDPVRRDVGDDDSSDSDTAPAGDDDDVAIVEKSLETIDLSEDNRDEDKTKEKVTRHSGSDGLGHTTVVVDEQNVPDTIVPQVAADTSDKPNVPIQERKRSLHVEKPDKNRENRNSKKLSRNKIDKTIDINKEIVDLDAPSPKADVVEALRELDVNNIETTIIFDSDEEEFKVNNKDLEVPNNANEDRVASTNEVTDHNESQINNDKAENRYRRQSSDSGDGNLVIDCGDDVNSENESSDNDAENTSTPIEPRKSGDHKTVWKAIEQEMLPQPLDSLPPVAGTNSKNNDTKGISHENLTQFPMLSEMLVSKCIFEGQSAAENMKVYYNTKTIREQSKAPKVYSNKKGEDSRTKSKTKKVSELILEARGEEAKGVKDDSSRSSNDSEETVEQEMETAAIDPKLLMDAVVVLERFPEPILNPVPISCLQPKFTRASSVSPSASREPSRAASPEPSSSLLIKSERRRSSSSLLSMSSPRRVSTPLLSRITPPRATSPLSCRTPSPPLSLFKNNLHPDSLFHYFASTLCPKFVFNKKNVPLIRMCKPCSVVLQRMDLSEKGRMGSRVAKKVELPDIEEVRRNNRCMLTAEVAPRRAKRASGSPPSPSSGSDSDWTPASEPAPEADSPPPGRGAARPRVGAAELGRLLDDLAGAGDETDCGHSKSTGMRGPSAAVLSSNCARCAARVLAAPPESGREARLQRQLLRRAVRAARTHQQELNTTTTSATTTTAAAPTTTTATVTTSATPTTTTSTTTLPTTATPTIVMTKAPEKRERPKYKKTPPLPLPPSLRRPPSPPCAVDAEAAAREWLRQKNLAAEKFGLKPRRYNKLAAPAHRHTPPATIQPIHADATTTDTVPKPPQPNEFSTVLNDASDGATVLPLTQENLAKHSPPTFRVTSSSVAPTLFNPDAVADINKKLGALAPQESVGFRPVITNVQSLSKSATSSNKVAPPPLKLNKVKKKDTAQHNIIIIPTSKNQTKIVVGQEETTKDDATTENQLPVLVNVAGGVHLLPSSVGQGLHLVVSHKNTQKSTSLLSNYQPNLGVSGNVVQGVQTSSWSKNMSQLPKYVVTSMSQNRPPLILNSVLAGSSQQSQPSLVLSSSNSSCQTVLISTMPRMSTVVTSQPSALFRSMPGRGVHSAPLVVRSVQAGPSGVAAQPVPAPHPAPAPPAPPAPLAPPAERTKRRDEEKVPDSEPNTTMLPRLEWRGAEASRLWARGRDSTALCVLCTGPQHDPGWLIAPRAGEAYLLVSEEQPPPRAPVYWALRPRVRLQLPGEEDGEPPEKRPKMSTPGSASNTTPSDSTESATKPGYLKVRAFARMAPEAKEADAGGHKDPEKLLAPPRVFVNKTVYQKMGDDPLVYAKLLVAVPNTLACRALLARGSALQLYCLRTGSLYPLDAEPKKDVSRITLSGDEEVSGALLMMARCLYKNIDPEQEMESNPEQEKNTVEHVVDDIYIEEFTDPAPSSEQTGQHADQRATQQAVQHAGQHAAQRVAQQAVEQATQRATQQAVQQAIQRAGQQAVQHAGQQAKRPRDAHSMLLNILATASKTIIQNQTQPPPPPPRAPAEVIELSDED